MVVGFQTHRTNLLLLHLLYWHLFTNLAYIVSVHCMHVRCTSAMHLSRLYVCAVNAPCEFPVHMPLLCRSGEGPHPHPRRSCGALFRPMADPLDPACCCSPGWRLRPPDSASPLGVEPRSPSSSARPEGTRHHHHSKIILFFLSWCARESIDF